MLGLDLARFHLSLAISGACLSGRCADAEKKTLTVEASRHYDKALKSINRRLSDEQAIHSDGMILSILGIALHSLTPAVPGKSSRASHWCWERVTFNAHIGDVLVPDQWCLHMKAIQVILDSRGGMSSLDQNRSLRHWLYL